MSELKPCPFCGGKAVMKEFKKTSIVPEFWDDASEERKHALNNLPDKWVMLGCNTKGCILYYDTSGHTASLFFRGKDKTIEERWNRRNNNDPH